MIATARPRIAWSRWFAWLLVPLAALALLAAAGLWLLRTQAGATWALAHTPGVKAEGVAGTLLGGELRVQRLDIALPGDGAVTLDSAAWQGLRFERAAHWRPRIVIDRLAAERVTVRPGTSDGAPAPAPSSLELPLELQIASVEIATLQATPLGDTPVRQLRARLHLGDDAGARHHVDALSLAWGQLRAHASVSIGATAPLPVQATLSLEQELSAQEAAAGAAWSAQATLAGALASPRLQASLRAQPAAVARAKPASAQTLDLSAELRPFERWPLGELRARAQNLDLAGLHPAAPATAISGEAHARTPTTGQPIELEARLDNAAPGLWNEGRLPLRRLDIALRASADDLGTLTLQTFAAELGTSRQAAGRIEGNGHWSSDGWSLDARLAALQPDRLDARAPAMRLNGPLSASGNAPQAAPHGVSVRGDLAGVVTALAPQRGAGSDVRLSFDGQWQQENGADRIALRAAEARAGSARASLTGNAARTSADAAWRLQGQAALTRFDPSLWWYGREGSAWQRGPHELNSRAEFDLTLPLGTIAGALERLAALRGHAHAEIAESRLAGVPVRGEFKLDGDGNGLQASAKTELDGNRLDVQGRLAATRGGAGDRWTLTLAAPALARLAPLARLAAIDGEFAGAASGRIETEGRWPALASRGEVRAEALRVGTLQLGSGTARWEAATALEAPVDIDAQLAGLVLGPAHASTARLRARGSGRAHRLELVADTNARPPQWAAAVPTDAKTPTQIRLVAQGGFIANAASAVDGWRGTLQQIDTRAAGAETAWLSARDIALEFGGLDTGAARLSLQPGRAEVLGAVLRWSHVAWQAAQGNTVPARIDAEAELDPLAVAPLLQRAQPAFGWGGDLRLRGRLALHSAPSFAADIVLERERGDLSVTDETGTQALGLTDLRLGLNVADGTWSFTQGLAGSTLGVAVGAFVARTSPQATWPAPDAPVSGVLELRVDNLGTWGTWVPAGWRLGGKLSVKAGIGGRFGAPEYTGSVDGREISARNFLQGVNVHDGEVALALQGDRARIERFTARAGEGTLTLAGEATLGTAPRAQLQLEAQHFQLLGRVDRRIVTSGRAQLQLERERARLDGSFTVDEGLFDFSRSDAPSLSDDVVVTRATDTKPHAPAANAAATARPMALEMDLRVDLGRKLQLRGRGLETGLQGELRLTAPNGKLSVDGTVRAVGGTYAAYGQKLEIDRGQVVFNGPAENPRLDIEATRPNLDVRVGVAVTGTAVSPRVRLFSEPEMSDTDKLSWLVLGRASDGLGRADTALLQRAALALLAGEDPGPTDQLLQALGLDQLSVRQNDEGEVRETVVSLGKQLSRRWYVGYERSLNATAGTWQLIYRVAQRFTLRAQAGEDSALDVIWTWRWN